MCAMKTVDMTEEQLRVLKVAAELGSFSITREYHGRWPREYRRMRDLELAGLMKFEQLSQDILTKQVTRKSIITEAGRTALRRWGRKMA
jgi:hypothetical protein